MSRPRWEIPILVAMTKIEPSHTHDFDRYLDQIERRHPRLYKELRRLPPKVAAEIVIDAVLGPANFGKPKPLNLGNPQSGQDLEDQRDVGRTFMFGEESKMAAEHPRAGKNSFGRTR